MVSTSAVLKFSYCDCDSSAAFGPAAQGLPGPVQRAEYLFQSVDRAEGPTFCPFSLPTSATRRADFPAIRDLTETLPVDLRSTYRWGVTPDSSNANSRPPVRDGTATHRLHCKQLGKSLNSLRTGRLKGPESARIEKPGCSERAGIYCSANTASQKSFGVSMISCS